MSTHPNQGTGYARVANKITNYLASLDDVEVVYYAFQNYPGQDIKDRFIDERIKFYDAIVEDPDSPKGFGDKGILPAIIKENPDVLFLYNDLPVCCSILNMIPLGNMPKVKYLYLDIVYPWEKLSYYKILKSHNIDKIFVFLECWKKHLIDDIGFQTHKIEVLPHGVDFAVFRDLSMEECKQDMGFEKDDFIFINMNRNSYRKQWFLTIQAFLGLLKDVDMDPKLKLFCGCMEHTDDGYTLIDIIHTECYKLNLNMNDVIQKHIFINSKPLHLSDENINTIYNMGDVGINTCCGEGFGLTTCEHSYFNKPQIASGVPALKETIGEFAMIVEPKVWSTVSNIESHSGEIAHFDAEDFKEKMRYCYDNRHQTINSRSIIEEKYSWENVYKKLEPFFTKE